jgi:hypothetical protein
MSEFIVWDEELKFFGEPEKYLMNGNGKLFFDNDDTYLYDQTDKLTFHSYIGKTDDTPNKNKIYADCSIVEFEYIGSSGIFKDIGYFTYNVLDCRYQVNTKNTSFGYDRFLFKNLKVIGNIFENGY